MEVHGECDPKFNKVKETFQKLYKEDREIGSCFAVYQDGRPIVDLWGGYQDQDRTKPWEKETIVTVYLFKRLIISSSINQILSWPQVVKVSPPPTSLKEGTPQE